MHNFSMTQEFIQKINQKDSETLAKIVRTYTQNLYNASYKFSLSESDMSELVQSVWTTFFENAHKFKGKSHIKTYLFGILYNKSKELKRERIKHTSDNVFEDVMGRYFDETGHWNYELSDPEKFINTAQSLKIIETCMQKLPQSQKDVFHLKEIEGYASKEICNILDITNTNLGVLFFRAKNALRSCVERGLK